MEKVKHCRLRPVIGDTDPHPHVLRRILGVLHQDIEIPVFRKDARVRQFELGTVFAAAVILVNELRIGKCRLRILVQYFMYECVGVLSR